MSETMGKILPVSLGVDSPACGTIHFSSYGAVLGCLNCSRLSREYQIPDRKVVRGNLGFRKSKSLYASKEVECM